MIVIATGNKGKFGEIAQYLSGIGEGLLSLGDLDASFAVAEDRPTYVENAWKKARKIGNRFGIKTLADDSGLEVDALNGAPGVHSARYGATDAERVERLLRALKGVEQKGRGAVFKAYLVYYLPDVEQTFIFYGSVRGYIGFEKRGELGFGFDPVFMLPGIEKSLSELGMEEKNRVSHRGQALAAFRAFLGI